MFGRGLIPTSSEPSFQCGRCGWEGDWPRKILYQDIRCCPDCGDEVDAVRA